MIKNSFVPQILMYTYKKNSFSPESLMYIFEKKSKFLSILWILTNAFEIDANVANFVYYGKTLLRTCRVWNLRQANLEIFSRLCNKSRSFTNTHIPAHFSHWKNTKADSIQTVELVVTCALLAFSSSSSYQGNPSAFISACLTSSPVLKYRRYFTKLKTFNHIHEVV